jgi:hypothetical protein
MIGGFSTLFLLWLVGVVQIYMKNHRLAGVRLTPVYLLQLDPLVYGFLVSIAAGIVVSLWSRPLPADHVNRYFLEHQNSAEPSNQDS